MNKLLITGGSGLVGGHVADRARVNWDVYATYQSNPFTMPSVQSVQLNLDDKKSISDIIRRIRPDVVIHCAAWSSLDQCEQNRKRAFQINTESTALLAELCAESGAWLIYTSSDMVFNGKQGNYTESDPLNPINVYGETKLSAEEKIRSTCSNYVIVRVALVYGKPVSRGNSFSEKILSRFHEGGTFSLFTDQFRTPVWVQTLADALLELADNHYTGVLHIGGSEKVDRFTFGLILAEIVRYPSKLCKPVRMSDFKTIALRPKDVSLNISLAKNILKIPFIDYRQGLLLDYSPDKNEIL
jgi:dTDP-4-dehydrorhamnose reductase